MGKKVAVVCANGRVAKQVIKEAVSRGLQVKAFQRDKEATEAQEVVVKDLFDLTYGASYLFIPK